MPRGNPNMEAVRAARQSPEQRFRARCEVQENGCIFWTGRTNGRGYGQMYVDGKIVMVHRYAWFLATGAWPTMVLDHACQNTLCVNVAHLEDVHPVENSRRVAERRGTPRAATNPRPDKTKCRSGKHNWVPSNIINSPNGPQCRACVAERRQERYAAAKYPTE